MTVNTSLLQSTKIVDTQRLFSFFAKNMDPLLLWAHAPDGGQCCAKTFSLTKDRDTFRAWRSLRQKAGWNVYFHPNASTQIAAKATKNSICAIRAVFVDVDARCGRSLLECEAAIYQIPVPASLVWFTGGGFQALWLLKESLPADAFNVALAEAAGKSLAAATGGDAVWNVDRVLRFPGSVNFPNEKKRASGRVVTLGKIVGGSGAGISVAEFHQLLPEGPKLSVRSDSTANADLAAGMDSGWWHRLCASDRSAALAEILSRPTVIALADTSDAAPEPNWRTIIAAGIRSGAPDAEKRLREWAMTSARYSERHFDSAIAYYGRTAK